MRLEDCEVKIVPSPIQESPHDHIEIYFTNKRFTGKYAVISAGEEFGEQGIVVGCYPHMEASAIEDGPQLCATFSEAMSLLSHYASTA